MNFYSVIIGSELLNGRRVDSHFKTFNTKLIERGYKHLASFVIEDKPEFIINIFNFIKNDPKAIMFCFGGIGATPDDFTRECASKAFTDGQMEQNSEAFKLIVEKFGDDAYPYRVNMAKLPMGAKLLSNPVTKIPGFYLQERYFFVPGFPSMAYPMIDEALGLYFPKLEQTKRVSFLIFDTENSIIELMEKLPAELEASSLPRIEGVKRSTVLSISHNDFEFIEQYSNQIIKYLNAYSIEFESLSEA